MEEITIKQEHYNKILAKSKCWDTLESKISKFYYNKNGEYDEENPERKGDLCDIGEVAASAFGFL